MQGKVIERLNALQGTDLSTGQLIAWLEKATLVERRFLLRKSQDRSVTDERSPWAEPGVHEMQSSFRSAARRQRRGIATMRSSPRR
jgi:hypothetical protein